MGLGGRHLQSASSNGCQNRGALRWKKSGTVNPWTKGRLGLRWREERRGRRWKLHELPKLKSATDPIPLAPLQPTLHDIRQLGFVFIAIVPISFVNLIISVYSYVLL